MYIKCNQSCAQRTVKCTVFYTIREQFANEIIYYKMLKPYIINTTLCSGWLQLLPNKSLNKEIKGSKQGLKSAAQPQVNEAYRFNEKLHTNEISIMEMTVRSITKHEEN